MFRLHTYMAQNLLTYITGEMIRTGKYCPQLEHWVSTIQFNGLRTLTSRISAAYLDLDIGAWNIRLRLPEQKLC